MQPLTSFLCASVLLPAAETLPSVQPPTFVRFLTFLYWLLSLLYFSYFPVIYFSYFAFTFFSSSTHVLSHTVFHFSYLMEPLRETSLILLCCSTVCGSLNYYTCTSILFVLHKCRNFFCVAHFGAAILVFSARFGAASCCCNFAFCSTTYVRPLSHLSLLAFVTFVFFTLRCHLFFILRCHLFFFINSCAFSCCLSFLLPDEACG